MANLERDIERQSGGDKTATDKPHDQSERAGPKKGRVTRVLRIVMPIVGLICIITLPPWNGIWAWLAPLPESVQQQVDDAVNYDVDGIIVCVDRSGQEPALFAAGWKDRANQIPADPKALFKIASLSKLYIAAAATKLVYDEKLSLDDSLADHLPELVEKFENAHQITLRMMLQNRSGIPSYTDLAEFDWAMPPNSTDAFLDLVSGRPADFQPDAEYRYSNTNFLLIGDILDRVLGYPHQQYISTELLAPLGITQTFGGSELVDPMELSGGYHHSFEDDFKGVEYIAPGGTMVASAQDVSTFLRALNDGSLWSEGEQAIYSTVYEFGHKGWLLGYQCIARYHEDIDTVVVQFVNTTGGDSELVALVVYDRLVEILREQYSAADGA